MPASPTTPHAVRAELLTQWYHWYAYTRLAAMANVTSADQIQRAKLTDQPMVGRDGNGREVSVSMKDLKDGLARVENIIHLPSRINQSRLSPSSFLPMSSWFDGPIKNMDYIAPTLWEWVQEGGETFFVEPTCREDTSAPAASASGMIVNLPRKNFMLRADSGVSLLFGSQERLLLDTFSVRWNDSSSRIEIVPIPRVVSGTSHLINEKKMLKLWRLCTKRNDPEKVKARINQEMELLRRAYNFWFPGMRLFLSGTRVEGGVRLTGQGQSLVAGNYQDLSQEKTKELSDGCVSAVVNALRKITEVEDAVRAARQDRFQRRSTNAGGAMGVEFLRMFADTPLFHIGSTRWLRASGVEVEDLAPAEGVKKRKSPHPHPRYCRYRIGVDGVIKPISVMGWDALTHGYPQGRYTVVCST